MVKLKRLVRNYKRKLNRYRREVRYMFPSPAEMTFVEIMGGKVLRIKWLKHWRTGFPFAVVLWRGWLLWREGVKREVYASGYYCDFASNIQRAIEIDGNEYHKDYIADSQRDWHLKQAGWIVLRIPAWRLYNQPDLVRSEVRKFLTH